MTSKLIRLHSDYINSWRKLSAELARMSKKRGNADCDCEDPGIDDIVCMVGDDGLDYVYCLTCGGIR